MLEAEQTGKHNTAGQETRAVSCKNNRQDQDTIEEAVVLEVNMVNNEKSRGKQYRKRRSM
jgi:hypothetical protein